MAYYNDEDYEGVHGQLKTNQGFYIGDICYVLDREIYHGYWGKIQKFRDGLYEVSEQSKHAFAVAGTKYGDGEYVDTGNHSYFVDSGTIGAVTYELMNAHLRPSAPMTPDSSYGALFVPTDGPATMYFDVETKGIFNIRIVSEGGTEVLNISIDTVGGEERDYYDRLDDEDTDSDEVDG